MNPTLFGAYKIRPTLFDGIELPAPLNRDALLDYIMGEYGASAVLENDPMMMELQIASWAVRKKWSWDKLVQLMLAEYNPLENYDRVENWRDTRTPDLEHKTIYGRTDTRTDALDETTKHGRKDTRTDNLSEERKTSAYNDSGYSPEGMRLNTGTQEQSASGQDVRENRGTQTTKAGGDDVKTEKGQEITVRDGRAHGNIGTMATQQMFQMEEELIQRFDVYQLIGDSFADRFMLPVW